MIEIEIPGRYNFSLEHLLLDVNGTIAFDGTIIGGVKQRIQELSEKLNIYIVTANTQNNADYLQQELGREPHIISPGQEASQKLSLANLLTKERCVSIGNGENDVLMLKQCAIGICVVGKEGASAEAVQHCDIVVYCINDALDLLLNPKRLIATLRK
ncbi:HAD family hydrolase [Chloroflexota bacterium]